MTSVVNCKQSRKSISLFALAAMLIPLHTAAGLAADEKGIMDEKALSVLQGMSDYLGASKTLSFESMTFFDIVSKSGVKIKAGRQSEVLLERPNRVNINAHGDDGSGVTIWYNGEKLTYWRRDKNEVASIDFKGSTDGMLNEIVKEYDITLPLADLFYSDVKKMFADDILSAQYVGIRIVNGVPCHQLSFESVGADWQIWVEADATPVPRRFVIDFVADDNKPQYMASLNNWSIGGEIGEFNFVEAVPDSAKRVEFKKPE
jgi:hypothetical protein